MTRHSGSGAVGSHEWLNPAFQHGRRFLEALAVYLPEAMRTGLERVLADALPEPDDEEAKMSNDETAQAALALLPEVEGDALAVAARWECGKR